MVTCARNASIAKRRRRRAGPPNCLVFGFRKIGIYVYANYTSVVKWMDLVSSITFCVMCSVGFSLDRAPLQFIFGMSALRRLNASQV